MASDSKVLKREYDLTWFSTYGEPLTPKVSLVTDVYRDRVWNRQFASRREAYRFLVSNGYLPTLPYVDNLQEVVRSKAVRVTGQLSSDPRSTFDWSFIPVYNRVDVDVNADWKLAELENTISARLASKVSGHGASLPMSLAEMPSSISMIAGAAAKLSRSYTLVKHGKFRAAAANLGIKTPRGVSITKTAANNWLQYRYGWRLVCFDVQSYLQTIYDLMQKPALHRVTAFEPAVGKWDRSYWENFYLPTGAHALRVMTRRITTWDTQVRGGYVFEIENETLNTLESFGLLNPGYFLWDKIAFSFVVDWFVNIGDVLQTLTAFSGKACKDGWVCRSIQSSTDTMWVETHPGSDVHSINSCSGLVISGQKERRFRRDPRGFTPASLRLSFGMNTSRLADAISLLRTIR